MQSCLDGAPSQGALSARSALALAAALAAVPLASATGTWPRAWPWAWASETFWKSVLPALGLGCLGDLGLDERLIAKADS